MGVLSVPLLPSLSPPSSSSGACRTLNRNAFSFNGTHSRAARVRTRFISVRADASLSELAPTAAVSLSELAPTVAAVYGGVLLGGGFYAYTKSSSVGSLLGGISGGFLMGLVFFLTLNLDSKDLGEAIGFGTALLFLAVFGIRLAATKKVFPGVPLLLVSMAASAVFMGAYLQDRV